MVHVVEATGVKEERGREVDTVQLQPAGPTSPPGEKQASSQF